MRLDGKFLQLLSVVAAIGLSLEAPAAAAAAPAHSGHAQPIGRVQRVTHGTVYNTHWSGYAATGKNGAFTSITANWTQPSADCSQTPTAYSSFWVGLDGYTDSTVEQIGTDSDCSNGAPKYYAWYEMYPKLSGQLVTLNAGDSISATVSTDGKGNFTLSMSVDGTPQTPVTGFSKRAALASAEVIAEAPSRNHGPFGTLSLTHFSTVSFNSAQANGSNLYTFSPDEIVMTTDGTSTGTVKAQPSVLSGGSFSVTWKHA